MKKAAAYARVSTKKQSETSLETQLEDCRRFASTNGIRITAEFTDKITASGYAKRPTENGTTLSYTSRIALNVTM